MGGDGNDTLTGGVGDILQGRAGNNLFIFTNGDGADTVDDFTEGVQSDDVLNVSASGLNDLIALLAVTSEQGNDAVIALDNNDQVTLLGVAKADLHKDDFLFA